MRWIWTEGRGGAITSRSVKCVESMCPQHLQRRPIFFVVKAPLWGTIVIVLFKSGALVDARADFGLSFFLDLPTVALLRPLCTQSIHTRERKRGRGRKTEIRRAQGQERLTRLSAAQSAARHGK